MTIVLLTGLILHSGKEVGDMSLTVDSVCRLSE